MNLRIAGIAITLAAVLVLVGSGVYQLLGGSAGSVRRIPADRAGPRVTVEVHNSTSISGLARIATNRLRDAGFDVVIIGNTREFGPDSSLVLDRIGRLQTAREVAAAVGIDSVVSQPDTTRLVDVTVVLGRNWVGIPRETAAAAPFDSMLTPD